MNIFSDTAIFVLLAIVSLGLFIFSSRSIDFIFKKLKVKNSTLNLFSTRQLSKFFDRILKALFKSSRA